MPSPPDAAIELLLGTSRTTRCHNPLFRKQQLKSLHDVLRHNVPAIREAIKQDTSATDTEITAEIAAVLDIVKRHYAGIDPRKELEDEYKVKKREDADERTVPWGVVYIEPETRHTPFFSVVVPVCVAVAAGNCVVVKLEKTLQALPSLLHTLLPSALEADTFQITTSPPSPSATTPCLSVLQSDLETPQPPSYTQLVSRSSARVVAVVDRTADLATAAEHLVTARFAHGGTSPYAPDLVLVNDFAKREFLEHVLKHALRFLFPTSRSTDTGTDPPSSKPSPGKSLEPFFPQNSHWTLTPISQSPTGAAVAELTCSSTAIVPLPPKPVPPTSTLPVLCIHAITSLDHAVDLIANDSDSDDRLLAAYHFAAPAAAKYLSQFVPADVSFANHVPPALLLGPAAPLGHAVELVARYAPTMFARASPVYVAATSTGGGAAKEADVLLREASREIEEARKRREWLSVGFFEQGILIGLGVYGVPVLVCLGATVWLGVRAGVRKWASLSLSSASASAGGW